MKKVFAVILALMLAVTGMAVSVSAASVKTTDNNVKTQASGRAQLGKKTGAKVSGEKKDKSKTSEVSGTLASPADTSVYGGKAGENLDFVNIPVSVEAYGPVELEHVGSGAENIHGNPAVYFEDSKMHIGVDANVMGQQAHL